MSFSKSARSSSSLPFTAWLLMPGGAQREARSEIISFATHGEAGVAQPIRGADASTYQR